MLRIMIGKKGRVSGIACSCCLERVVFAVFVVAAEAENGSHDDEEIDDSTAGSNKRKRRFLPPIRVERLSSRLLLNTSAIVVLHLEFASLRCGNGASS